MSLILFAADYGLLPQSSDPRDLLEVKFWGLKGKRVETFLQERYFLRLCFNLVMDLPLSAPRPVIERVSHGKPYFQGRPAYFNLTNSGAAVLLLISKEHPVGVDLERLRPRKNLAALGRRIFTPAEQEKFSSLNVAAAGDHSSAFALQDQGNAMAQGQEYNAAQLQYFLQRWTWRECLLKTSGIALAGLSGIAADHEHPDDDHCLYSPLNHSGTLYSYHSADLGFEAGFFSVYPGGSSDAEAAGKLCCRILTGVETAENESAAAAPLFETRQLLPCTAARITGGADL